MMGCSPGDAECADDESPAHQVTLTNAFYMGKTEVTQAQWQAQMGYNPSYFQGQSDSPSRPVEQVSWNMSRDFITATGLRYPTEAEWELACRAGTTTRFASGNDAELLAKYAVFQASGTGIGGHKMPNGWGLFDMHGNNWEWCQDRHAPFDAPNSVINPMGPGVGSNRVCRGGGWDFVADHCQSFSRRNHQPLHRSHYLGFRVAKHLDP